jgi:hypothetical protein
MLNRAPIFVGGFARGGTTIVMNLVASHPRVCTVGETHQVFKGRNITDTPWQILHRVLRYDAPVILATRQNLFSPRLMRPRKPISPRVARFIDRILYDEKLVSRHDQYNRFKSPGLEYTLAEIATARLLCKNLDGAIYLNDLFRSMYSDAVFVYLVRNGLAICEGRMRRGRTADECGRLYRQLAERMLADVQRLPNVFLVRFEDILQDPYAATLGLYGRLGLQPDEVTHVRVQLRGKLDGQGRHGVEGGTEWEVVWHRLDELADCLDPEINARQIRRLSAADREAFLREAGDVMDQFGYTTDPAAPLPLAPAFRTVA